jgi:Ti-type conjugative transfer relaxase TraA
VAIYHLTATVISRARGQSMAAAAAYRSGSALRDERYGLVHNYTRNRRGAHAEIMAPETAPAWVHDREILWNRVEAAERRKDSQLARAIEISLPAELSAAENVALLRDYIAQEFVSKGMIADFCIRRSDPGNPHAHILLTLREPTPSGFGPKARHWNRKSSLFEWRQAWAERANQHLARAGHSVRIDHRTLEAQQSELTPARQMGVGRGRQADDRLPDHIKERVAEQQRIARENGEMIVEDPSVALRALTRYRPSFTRQDMLEFLRSRTGDAAQLDAVVAAIMESNELVELPAENGRPARFSSRDMLEAEKSLAKRVATLVKRRGHGAAAAPGMPELALRLTEAQRSALQYLLGEGDIKALTVTPGDDLNALLAAARQAWESRGLRIAGAAVSRVAVERLQAASGIESQTLHSQEDEWREGRGLPTQNHVLVVDGAEMIGLKQLERLLAVADKAHAKLVLIGDALQLAAMQSMSPLQNIVAAVGPTG